MTRWLILFAVLAACAWNNAHLQRRLAVLRAELAAQQHAEAQALVDQARELREALR